MAELTCSNCIHSDVCENRFSWLDQKDNTKYITCHHFKNKADVAEVKHGYWKDNTNGTFTCSECGGRASKMDWCGCCGAKMDGERKDT